MDVLLQRMSFSPPLHLTHSPQSVNRLRRKCNQSALFQNTSGLLNTLLIYIVSIYLFYYRFHENYYTII